MEERYKEIQENLSNLGFNLLDESEDKGDSKIRNLANITLIMASLIIEDEIFLHFHDYIQTYAKANLYDILADNEDDNIRVNFQKLIEKITLNEKK